MRSLPACSRWFVLMLMIAGVLWSAGCGEEGPPRYNLSGKVTYGGQPVPAGSVTLIPDGAQGNKGAAASIQIRNGTYDSQAEQTGHFGGAYLVRVTALDGVTSPEMPMGTPLFPDYEFQLELPAEDGTHDFDVPLDWVPKKLPPVTDHGA